MSRTQFRIVPFVLAAALVANVSAQAAEIWTWIGGTADVADLNNWTTSNPTALPGPPGVQAGAQGDRFASFGATGSTTLTQINPNYWLEQFIYQPGAQSYTYTATDAAGYLSLAPAATNVDRVVIDNQSTNRQTINMPSGGKIGIDGYVKSNAGGGDIVINGPVWVSDTNSTTTANTGRYMIVTGSGNTYFNVDSSVLPGNVPGAGWVAVAANGNYNNIRNRFWTDDLSGRAYLGDIGTLYKGTINLSSNKGGKVQLTHNNALGNPGSLGGFGGTGSTAVVIYGGDANVDAATGYNTTLELAGGVSVRRAVMWMGPREGALIGNTPHISSVSGNNTLNIGGDWNTHGSGSFSSGFISGNWNIESQSGSHLTITGGAGATSGVVFNTANVTVDLQLMGAGDGQFDAPISNYQSNPGLNLIMLGTGTWTLAHATNDYKGTTTISAGTLLVTGGYTGTASWIVDAAGTVGGTGHIDAPVTLNGTLAPGTSPGMLTVNNSFTVGSGSVFSYELSTPGDLTDDQLTVVGDLAFLGGANTLNVTKIGGGNLSRGNYLLVDATSLSGSIPTTTINAPIANGSTASIYVDGANSDVYLQVIPEPTTLGLACIGLIGFAALYRRRRS